MNAVGYGLLPVKIPGAPVGRTLVLTVPALHKVFAGAPVCGHGQRLVGNLAKDREDIRVRLGSEYLGDVEPEVRIFGDFPFGPEPHANVSGRGSQDRDRRAPLVVTLLLVVVPV